MSGCYKSCGHGTIWVCHIRSGEEHTGNPVTCEEDKLIIKGQRFLNFPCRSIQEEVVSRTQMVDTQAENMIDRYNELPRRVLAHNLYVAAYLLLARCVRLERTVCEY